MGRFGEEGATAELTRWTSADLERESPEATWRTPSFFFRFRVFVLPDLAEVKKGPREVILKYLGTPEPSVVLVLHCTDRNVVKAFSVLSGVKAMVPREEQVVSALAGFAVSCAGAAGKKFPEDVAAFLVRWVGLDYARVKEEVGKLLTFASDRAEIGEEEVREVCVARGAVDPFGLAERLVSGNRKECLSMFRKFAAGAESADYHGLVGAIAWFVRRRLVARATTPSQEERGGEILAALSRIDRGMKGESGLSPEQLFEIQILKLLG
jgi:DNA polymerase III delta subunit